MTFTALPQFTAAVIAALRGDVAFKASVAGIFDEVPALAQYPYIVVDQPFETPDPTFGQNGHQSMITLSIFTQTPATRILSGPAAWRVGLAIAEAALAILTDIEHHPITVAEHDVVDCDVISIDCARIGDGKTRRVDLVLMAQLEDAQ